MTVARTMSPRTEKTIRLVGVCAFSSIFGITAVVRDSEALGWIAISLMLAGILVGPLSARLLTRRDDS